MIGPNSRYATQGVVMAIEASETSSMIKSIAKLFTDLCNSNTITPIQFEQVQYLINYEYKLDTNSHTPYIHIYFHLHTLATYA